MQDNENGTVCLMSIYFGGKIVGHPEIYIVLVVGQVEQPGT